MLRALARGNQLILAQMLLLQQSKCQLGQQAGQLPEREQGVGERDKWELPANDDHLHLKPEFFMQMLATIFYCSRFHLKIC